MITAPYDELKHLGFQPLRAGKGWTESEGIRGEENQKKERGKYLGLITRTIAGRVAILAEQFKDGVYKIFEARDTKGKELKESELDSLPINNVDELFYLLEGSSQRFSGIEFETRQILERIALAPPTESIDEQRDRVLAKMRRYSPEIRRKMECELIAAEFAHDHNRLYN
jgi:hypothetical protein